MIYQAGYQFLVLSKRLIKNLFNIIKSIFNGIFLLWELFAVAFVYFFNDELLEDVRMSTLARVSLIIGFIMTTLIFVHATRHNWPYENIAYLSYQGLRVLHFLGRTPYE